MRPFNQPRARWQVAAVKALLIYGVLCQTQPLYEKSAKLTKQECIRSGGAHRLNDILAGKLDAYSFTGPQADECTADGCKHPYWGPRCRWTGTEAPACPKESRDGLIQLLKDYASNGADWASDALSIQPCELWEEVKGQTVWFVGDSVSQESSHAFLCFLVEYMFTTKPAPRITEDKHLMHRLTHNANNAEMTTWCGLLEENTRVCMLRTNFGPRMASVMLPALTQIIEPRDVVILNFGLWSNSIDELKMHALMFEAAFDFHRSMLPNRTFWRETTAQHYFTPSGMYDTSTPVTEQKCRPIYPGVNITIGVNGSLMPMPGMALPQQYSPDDWEMQKVMEGGLRNLATQPIMDRLGLHTIPAWNTSVALWQFHHNVHFKEESQVCAKLNCDCTHSCQPSWQQIWLPEFLRAFKDPNLHMKGGRQDPRDDGPAPQTGLPLSRAMR